MEKSTKNWIIGISLALVAVFIFVAGVFAILLWGNRIKETVGGKQQTVITEQKKQKTEVKKDSPVPTKQEESVKKPSEDIDYLQITFYIFVLYILLSVKNVSPTECGLIVLFGKPEWNVESGWQLVPFGFCSLITETKLNIQDELPAEPEKIWRGTKDDENMPPELEKAGYKPPIRINFGPAVKGDDTYNDDPYNRQITVEVVPVITWKISDLKKFIQAVGSVENARRQMADAAIALFNIELSKVSPAYTQRNFEIYNGKLLEKIEAIVNDWEWGVTIVSAQIKPLKFNHEFNKSITKAAQATQDKKKTIIDAEGNAKKITLEGEANAEATLARLKAEAEGARLALEARSVGVTKLAEIAKTSEGQIVLWLDTMTKGFEKAQHTIVPGSEFFTALSNIKSILDKTKGAL